MSKQTKSRIFIHKGSEEKRIFRGYIDSYLKDGWSIGRSEENVKKLSETDTSRFQKGNIPWNKGKKNQLTDKQIQDLLCLYNQHIGLKKCAKQLNISFHTAYTYLKENNLMRNRSEAKIGHSTSEETKQKISEANTGHPVSEKTRKAVSKANKKRTPEQLRIQVTKAWLTKIINNTCNTSESEEKLYKQLLEENKTKTIYRQYKDYKRYPYYCDFYIKEDDIFIELNAHWTHGGHPYNPNDPEDIKLLNVWRDKAKTSRFYRNAIYVWTKLDPKKQKCARDHNLNYKAIY